MRASQLAIPTHLYLLHSKHEKFCIKFYILINFNCIHLEHFGRRAHLQSPGKAF